ncbi:hypothetical protein [Solilutibacter silvestris]|uniref:hypothetical protein n=1 Tax=Solilutibacter silvestris TaxID=1645665 RepID=UPI003D340A12
MKTSIRLAFFSLVFAATGVHAQDSIVTEQQRQHMEDAVVQAIPLGKIMGMAAAQNPSWPVSKDSKLDAGRLACLRQNLDEASYRRVVRKRVTDYSVNEPKRFAGDLALLEGDGGKLFAKAIMGGAQSQMGGKAFDSKAMLANESPRALMGMLSIANDPQYAPLRALLGLDSAVGDGQADNRGVGRRAGMTLMMPALIDAMDTCKVGFQDI